MTGWNRIVKPILVLGLICIVISGALAVTNSMTAPVIAESTARAQEQARKELLPDADAFHRVEIVPVENVSDVYVADNGVGTVITSHSKGYGGTITVMVAFTPEDTIKQIKITEQSETQGLGSRIATDANFQNSFSGLYAAPFTVDYIQAISGATISSKAVTKAVNAAVDAYRQLP